MILQIGKKPSIVNLGRRAVLVLACLSAGLIPFRAFGKKTNQTIIEDPYDTAAGGSTLTRATRENVILANPALMPYGGKFHRWLGTQFTIMANPESIDFVQSMIGQGDGGGEEGEGGAAAFIERVFETPVHAGVQNITSYTTNNVGFSLFARSELDISAREYGEYGMPELRFGVDAYAGGALGLALRAMPFLSFGVTAKYLFVAEPDIAVSFLDQERIAELSDAGALQEAASYGNGLGFDGGFLLFLQGHNLDFRFTGKVEDVGGTSFTGTQAPFKQTLHAGAALTFHTDADAIHLSVDYRDVQAAYEEPMFKRIYAGARMTIREYVGIAGGLYQGYPSFGARLDLLLMKLGATVYTKELGDYPGANPRTIYQVYFMTGF
jgi:hypothetical protein